MSVVSLHLNADAEVVAVAGGSARPGVAWRGGRIGVKGWPGVALECTSALAPGDAGWGQTSRAYRASLMKSAVQKAVRRRKTGAAVRLARQMIFQDREARDALFRRLPIIAIEDSLPHPTLIPLAVWCMLAVPQGYVLPRRVVEKLLVGVAEMADVAGRIHFPLARGEGDTTGSGSSSSSSNHDTDNAAAEGSAGGTSDAASVLGLPGVGPADAGNGAGGGDDEQNADDAVHLDPLRLAMYVRHTYGGFEGELRMLTDCYTHPRLQRMCRGLYAARGCGAALLRIGTPLDAPTPADTSNARDETREERRVRGVDWLALLHETRPHTTASRVDGIAPVPPVYSLERTAMELRRWAAHLLFGMRAGVRGSAAATAAPPPPHGDGERAETTTAAPPLGPPSTPAGGGGSGGDGGGFIRASAAAEVFASQFGTQVSQPPVIPPPRAAAGAPVAVCVVPPLGDDDRLFEGADAHCFRFLPGRAAEVARGYHMDFLTEETIRRLWWRCSSGVYSRHKPLLDTRVAAGTPVEGGGGDTCTGDDEYHWSLALPVIREVVGDLRPWDLPAHVTPKESAMQTPLLNPRAPGGGGGSSTAASQPFSSPSGTGAARAPAATPPKKRDRSNLKQPSIMAAFGSSAKRVRAGGGGTPPKAAATAARSKTPVGAKPAAPAPHDVIVLD